MLEPSFLAKVHARQFDSSDRDMVGIVKCALGTDAQFVVHNVHGIGLVYRAAGKHGELLQLVLPKVGGLRELMLQELHDSLYAAHLGVRKTISAFQQRVKWPQLPETVKRFVAGCEVC